MREHLLLTQVPALPLSSLHVSPTFLLLQSTVSGGGTSAMALEARHKVQAMAATMDPLVDARMGGA